MPFHVKRQYLLAMFSTMPPPFPMANALDVENHKVMKSASQCYTILSPWPDHFLAASSCQLVLCAVAVVQQNMKL